MKDRPDIRATENADLLRRFRAGESLAVVDHQATWWPPRPIIQKDQALIARALGAAPKPIVTHLNLAVE